MFKKNKKKDAALFSSYSNWESDFGFLILIMNKKIQYVLKYEIRPFSEQLEKPSDYIRDADVKEPFYSLVNEIYETLSDSYRSFLIAKYFKNESKLIEFISESVYDELLSASINENNKKISKQYSDQMIHKIQKMNKTTSKKEK